jgi:DNA-binding GntR family transcriptional regulator
VSPTSPPRRIPVDKRRLATQVANELRDLILTGGLQTGDQLKIVALAEELGLSTQPVREALLHLSIEGFVVGDPHKTLLVAPITLDDIRDVYLVHGFVSGVLAERAAKSLTDLDIETLEKLAAECERELGERNSAAASKLNTEFHHVISSSSGDHFLTTVLSDTVEYLSDQSYDHHFDGQMAAAAEHMAIIDALRKGDGALARKLVMQHTEQAGELTIAHYRSIQKF